MWSRRLNRLFRSINLGPIVGLNIYRFSCWDFIFDPCPHQLSNTTTHQGGKTKIKCIFPYFLLKFYLNYNLKVWSSPISQFLVWDSPRRSGPLRSVPTASSFFLTETLDHRSSPKHTCPINIGWTQIECNDMYDSTSDIPTEDPLDPQKHYERLTSAPSSSDSLK